MKCPLPEGWQLTTEELLEIAEVLQYQQENNGRMPPTVKSTTVLIFISSSKLIQLMTTDRGLRVIGDH